MTTRDQFFLIDCVLLMLTLIAVAVTDNAPARFITVAVVGMFLIKSPAREEKIP